MAEKRKFIAIGAIALVITLMGTLTYAFFVVNVGETKNETVQLTAGTMALTFSDNSDGINQALMFGESVTKDFKITNDGTLDAVAKISFDDLVNTYLAESLTYTLSYATSETEEYKVVKNGNVPRSETSSKVELADGLVVPDGETYYYRLIITLENLEDIDQTSDTSARLSTRFIMEEGRSTYAVTVSGLKLNVNKTTPNFAKAATTDEGVYAMTDDYGTSYYFRGSVENNYVKFGKWADDTPDVYYGYDSAGSIAKEHATLDACQSDETYNQNCTLNSRAGKDMYWRIIRVNGDGSVRMIYDGTQGYANGESNIDRVALASAGWNTNKYDAKYVGYMYGGADGVVSTAKTEADCAGQEDCVAAQKNETSSPAKIALENWYVKNLKENYGQYVADVLFCNDRSTPYDHHNLGYGPSEWTYYGGHSRFLTTGNDFNTTNPSPIFECVQDNDKFTVNDTRVGGNGALDYPVGMITIDEVIAAGGVSTKGNTNYYLYNGYDKATMTPALMYGGCCIHMFSFVHNGGFSYGYDGNNTLNAVPVINLTPEYVKTMLGTGEINDPYRAGE